MLQYSPQITGSLIISGTINGVDLLQLSQSLNGTLSAVQIATGSSEARLTRLENKSASVDTSISNINQFTASNNISLLNSYTQSNDTTNSNQYNRLANLENATGSYEIKGRGLVSGSSQIDIAQTTGYETFSGSIATSISASVAGATWVNISGKPGGLVSGSSQVTELLPVGTVSGSSQVIGILDSLNSETSSYAKTNVQNTFTATQTITGSLFVTQDLIVLGSSSIQNISSSRLDIGDNIIQLNVNNPSLRFGGIAIFDSGSAGSSGSLLFDSVEDEFVFVHKGNGVNVTSSHFIMGPETYDNLGNETYLINNRLPKATGKEHLVDSNITDSGTLITLGSNTTITGTLVASGTTLVSSSSQVSFTGIVDKPTLVSGSSQIDVMSTTNITRLATTGSNTFTGAQIISASLNVSGSTNFGGAFAVNDANMNLTNSSSLNLTLGSGIYVNSPGVISGSISGIGSVTTYSASVSSQFTSLITKTGSFATTGSNTFTANQTINGNISLGASNTSYIGPSQYGGVMFPRGGILFSNTNGQNQMYMASNAYLNGSGVWSYRISSQYAGYMAIDNGGFSVALAGNAGAADSAITFSTPLAISNAGVTTFGGNVIPDGNGTRDLGSSSARWSTVYTSDLSLNNGIGDWTIVEGEDDLFLYNNKKGKVYKFALTEVDPNVATPKKS